MAVTLSVAQLPALLHSLPDNSDACNIRGEIKCRLNSVITDYDFIVDSWPDYKALVVRVDPTTAKYPAYLGVLVSVFAKDSSALEALLQRPGVLDWKNDLAFLYVSRCTKSAVENVVRKQKIPYQICDDYFLSATIETLKLSSIPEGFTVTSLRPEQANLVSSTWKFSKEDTEGYVKDILEKLPSCCLCDKEGNVVGFALQYHYGALGMLNVLEDHRGKGYGKVIMSHLAYSCLQREKEVFVISNKENISSTKLHESIGFKKVSDYLCNEVWIST